MKNKKNNKKDNIAFNKAQMSSENVNRLVNVMLNNIECSGKVLCIGIASSMLARSISLKFGFENVYFIEDNVSRLPFRAVKKVIFCDLNSETEIKKIFKDMDKKFGLIIGNPPYAKNLHLKIIDAALNHLNDTGKAVFIHPARWYQDPLAEYKKGSDKKKFNKLVKMISDVKYIESIVANKLFSINNDTELMISEFTNKPHNKPLELPKIVINIISKILEYSLNANNSLFDLCEQKKYLGWRCEVKDIIPKCMGLNGKIRMDEYARQKSVGIIKTNGEVVFKDGLNKNGIVWWKTRAANGQEKSIEIPWSIEFPNEATALNFAESCRTRFYRNFTYLIKLDMNSPLKFLPYMHDYSKVWTDEDYCKFFGLTEEESKFMTREVYDYRVKDYIDYVVL